MTNRMSEKNYGVTYPLPVFLQVQWVWNLWAKFMCPNGWHLLDECQSLEKHYLFCDACEITVPISKDEVDNKE